MVPIVAPLDVSLPKLDGFASAMRRMMIRPPIPPTTKPTAAQIAGHVGESLSGRAPQRNARPLEVAITYFV